MVSKTTRNAGCDRCGWSGLSDERKRGLAKFLQDENGATAIEYALIGALVGVGLVAALTQLGTGLSNLFSSFSQWFGGDEAA